MAQHEHPNYMAIFVALTILTVLEVAVASMPFNRIVVAILLCIMAVLKAGLVAAYFMHLKFEPIRLIAIVLFPILLILAMVLATMPDALWTPKKKPAGEGSSSPRALVLDEG